MNKKILLSLMFLALLATACQATKVEQQAAPYLLPQPVEVQREMVAVETAGGYAPPGGAAAYEHTLDIQPTTVERIVIKNANLSIAVDDPTLSLERISQMAEEMGGFVVASNLYQTYLESGVQVPRASITIRVPAERLDEALRRIKEETTQPIISENVNSQDVTAEYTDLQSRLRNLEAAEAQLVEIMDAATKTEDVLAVYAQLTSVREQIEMIKGQMQYYEQSAALSAISVELIANEAVQPLTIGRWQPVGVAKDAVQALINTLKFLVNAAIWIVIYILPVMLIVFGPPILVVRALLKRRARRKAKTGPPTN